MTRNHRLNSRLNGGKPQKRARDPAAEASSPAGAAASAAGGAPAAAGTGLAVVEQAVAFTNAQVLAPGAGVAGSPPKGGLEVGALALAEQALAMMVQDLRGFLQGMELVVIAAVAKAVTEYFEGNLPPARKGGLSTQFGAPSSVDRASPGAPQVGEFLEALSAFAGDIVDLTELVPRRNRPKK
jgi:hypothetical protein